MSYVIMIKETPVYSSITVWCIYINTYSYDYSLTLEMPSFLVLVIFGRKYEIYQCFSICLVNSPFPWFLFGSLIGFTTVVSE